MGEWQATKIETTRDGMAFDIVRSESAVGRFTIPMPGTFNVQNALGAIIVAKELEIPNDGDSQPAWRLFRVNEPPRES